MGHAAAAESQGRVPEGLVTSSVCVYRQVNATKCEAPRPLSRSSRFLRYHVGVMQKSIRDIFQMIETPLISFTVVVLSCVCFLLGLWAIMIVVRLVMG